MKLIDKVKLYERIAHMDENPDLSDIKILVVEDETLDTALAQAYFHKLGCQTEYVQNGKDALEKLRDNEYDLCFMDVNIPTVNGLDVVKALEKYGIKPCPIVALTGTEDKQKCLDAGMDDYLNKPVTYEGLREKIIKHTQ